MEDQDRTILVVGALAAACLDAPAALARGWKLLEAHTHHAAQSLLSEHKGLRVGVWLGHTQNDPQELERFSEWRTRHGRVQWLALLPASAEMDDRLARFIAQNVVDYHTLPLELERFYAWAGHAHGMSLLLERASSSAVPPSGDRHIIGASPQVLQLARNIRKVAASNAPVFISGESGTGKDLTARSIHEQSARAGGPFVSVDCGAIPPTLIHSELFGYEKGAFTGAAQRKAGRIELADGGTVFLDEVGDLPFDLQGNLLRFLQESTIQRLGGTRPLKVDVRVIGATHVDLDEAVRQRRFREDLYYRLNVLRIQVPALRERGCDSELLARHFLAQFLNGSGKHIHGYTDGALAAIRRHPWPGNVRELINKVRRAMVMCDGQWITPEDLDLEAQPSRWEIQGLQLDAAREAAERQAVRKAIEMCSNNYSAAARVLGVSRVTLYRLLEKQRAPTEPFAG